MNATTIDVEQSNGCGVTAALVDGIAALEGREPTDLDICLGEHIDTDALEALFDGTTESTALELQIAIGEYDALVRSDGTVTVAAREYTPEAPAEATP
jgi:hypothetical protein